MTASLLDPLLVAKLATMELRARAVVEGVYAGLHRSAHRGHAQEFAGHRPYSPGDEWRRIDWKVYAKTDRWVVREEQEETNLRAVFLVDASLSMTYAAEGRLPKIRYAAVLAAALAYILVRQREAVGLGFFDRGLLSLMPPRGGAAHLSQLFDRLDAPPSGGETDVRRGLEDAGAQLPRRSLVFVLSDFLAPPEQAAAALRTLSLRKHDVCALQVLDPAEIRFPFEGDFLFEDLETGETLRADASDLGDAYRRRMAERLDSFARALASLGIGHQLFPTDDPFDRALARFLERRTAPPVPGAFAGA